MVSIKRRTHVSSRDSRFSAGSFSFLSPAGPGRRNGPESRNQTQTAATSQRHAIIRWHWCWNRRGQCTYEHPWPGVVRSIKLKTGDKAITQTPAIQLDNAAQTLAVEKAQLQVKLAQLGTKEFGANTEIGKIKLEIAQKELDLARMKLAETLLNTPFECEVFRIQAVAGQYVAPGEPLMTIADTSKLKVEIPVDRRQVQPGQSITLRVEDQQQSVKVESVLPLSSGFEKLRELFPTVASAVVVLDNSGGRFKPGQTVFADIIPRNPITELPNTALQNLADAAQPDQRQVQVIRNFVVRNVPVRVLSQVGASRSYVTGEFQDGDELITSSTVPLKDGSQVRPTTPAKPVKNSPGTTGPGSPTRRPSGF